MSTETKVIAILLLSLAFVFGGRLILLQMKIVQPPFRLHWGDFAAFLVAIVVLWYTLFR